MSYYSLQAIRPNPVPAPEKNGMASTESTASVGKVTIRESANCCHEHRERQIGLGNANYMVFVLLTTIRRFLGQSPLSDNKSVAAVYICPYIITKMTDSKPACSRF
jgi:hypothetical protein